VRKRQLNWAFGRSAANIGGTNETPASTPDNSLSQSPSDYESRPRQFAAADVADGLSVTRNAQTLQNRSQMPIGRESRPQQFGEADLQDALFATLDARTVKNRWLPTGSHADELFADQTEVDRLLSIGYLVK
jgi:hypothetical protein